MSSSYMYVGKILLTNRRVSTAEFQYKIQVFVTGPMNIHMYIRYIKFFRGYNTLQRNKNFGYTTLIFTL